jgi:hypothetical protein
MARSQHLGRHRHSFFATVALLILAVGPVAFAQSAPKAKKKGPKPAPSASASASAADEPTPTASAAPAEPTPEPAATETTTPPEAGTVSVASTEDADDITNTAEDPGKTYRFVGVRYRGTIIPSFLEHLFVNDGGTIYSNTIGAEIDFRKDAKSTVVWLQYTEYGFSDTLFFQKGQPDTPNNYSIVNSGLKGIYAGLDEQWSSPVANHLDFEYGFGLGLGVIFGSLTNDWAYLTPSMSGGAVPAHTVTADNGTQYTACQSVHDDPSSANSCATSAHQNPTTAKVGNYKEPNWFNGGAVPVIFPHIGGQLGLRWKPIKQIESRLQLGISLTGFWFGLSADYGLEDTGHGDKHPAAKPPAKEESPADHPSTEDKSSREVGLRDTL